MKLTNTVRLFAGGVLAGAAVFVAAGAALATAPATNPGHQGPCPGVVHTSATADIAKTAGGKATLDPDGGLVLETTVNADAVAWQWVPPAPVPIGAVTKLAYTTRKLDNGSVNAAALPAYRVVLADTNGPNSGATLVFEPYYQISGNPPVNTTQTWDVLAGKFWSSKTIGGITAEAGGSYAGNKTWAQIKAANPNAKVVAISVGQGTYNAGTKARVNHVIFAGAGKCVEHTWELPKMSPSGSVKPSVSVSPSSSVKPSTSTSTSPSGSVKPSVSVSPSGSVVPVVPANPGGGGTLPVTGAKVAGLIGIGLGMAAAGVGLFVIARRRRTRFVAAG